MLVHARLCTRTQTHTFLCRGVTSFVSNHKRLYEILIEVSGGEQILIEVSGGSRQMTSPAGKRRRPRAPGLPPPSSGMAVCRTPLSPRHRAPLHFLEVSTSTKSVFLREARGTKRGQTAERQRISGGGLLLPARRRINRSAASPTRARLQPDASWPSWTSWNHFPH